MDFELTFCNSTNSSEPSSKTFTIVFEEPPLAVPPEPKGIKSFALTVPPMNPTCLYTSTTQGFFCGINKLSGITCVEVVTVYPE